MPTEPPPCRHCCNDVAPHMRLEHLRPPPQLQSQPQDRPRRADPHPSSCPQGELLPNNGSCCDVALRLLAAVAILCRRFWRLLSSSLITESLHMYKFHRTTTKLSHKRRLVCNKSALLCVRCNQRLPTMPVSTAL
mmetsp:Transcript_71828/g.166170  ORF Transcript_71828/g.166170 Transcript_71828/m.166170 type:complete len:135 (+) Transcript_71828:62-466(+)